MILPTWMRNALLATAVMNLFGAGLFLPSAEDLREIAGLPQAEHPVYLAVLAMFVALFGVGYLWVAVAGRAERLFIGISALGKISFVALLTGFWLGGTLPLRAPLLASGDLVFGVLFLVWLVRE